MKMLKMECPQCAATLKIENGLDEYVCEYCGNRIMLDGLNKSTLDARVKIKEFEHKEKMVDKAIAFEKFKMLFEWKKARSDDKVIWLGIIGMMLVFL